MPLWRCPHCGTPQPEAARCWVCRRSSTTCGTCRNYRHAIAGNFGFCALDRTRSPLLGDEVKGCWEAALPHAPAPVLPGPATVATGSARSWTEVTLPAATTAAAAPAASPAAASVAVATPPGSNGRSDGDRRPAARRTRERGAFRSSERAAARRLLDGPPVGLWGEIET